VVPGVNHVEPRLYDYHSPAAEVVVLPTMLRITE
jgi:hypothetical protein